MAKTENTVCKQTICSPFPWLKAGSAASQSMKLEKKELFGLIELNVSPFSEQSSVRLAHVQSIRDAVSVSKSSSPWAWIFSTSVLAKHLHSTKDSLRPVIRDDCCLTSLLPCHSLTRMLTFLVPVNHAMPWASFASLPPIPLISRGNHKNDSLGETSLGDSTSVTLCSCSTGAVCLITHRDLESMWLASAGSWIHSPVAPHAKPVMFVVFFLNDCTFSSGSSDSVIEASIPWVSPTFSNLVNLPFCS